MAVGDRAREAMGLGARSEPGKELSPLDRRIGELRNAENIFERAAVGGVSASVLVRDAETALRNLPELAKCDRTTFFGALMTPAQLGLRPNVASLGHGWILPFWSGQNQRHEAKWILGYQGMVELGYKSGLVEQIDAATIYSNEHYEVHRGTRNELIHEPILDIDARGEAIAHYAVVWLKTGRAIWQIMGDSQVRKIMERSQTGSRGKGPWVSDYDAMAQKTPLRALWRFMPKTEILSLALATDTAVRQLDETRPSSVTITHADDSENGDAQSEPAEPADEPVDADIVPEPEPASVEQGDGNEQPSGRQALKDTPTRRGLIASIEQKHGPDWGTAAEIVAGDQSIYALDTATTDELRAILAVSTEAIREFLGQ